MLHVIRILLKFWPILCFFNTIGLPNRIAQDDSASSQNVAEESIIRSVDFDQEILPILQTHCFDCHSEHSNEGDLRLDDEQLAQRGGHTGRLLLVSPAEKSELYQRLISSDPSYRMPKKSEPLSASEIALIKSWLDQGAKWGSKILTSPAGNTPRIDRPIQAKNSKETLDLLGLELSDFFENANRPRYRHLSNLSWFVVGWLLLLLLTVLNKSKRFWRGWKRRDSGVSIPKSGPQTQRSLLERLCDWLLLWRWLCLGLLAILGSAAFLYQKGRIEELEATLQKVESSVRRQPVPRITEDRKNLVLPVYPDHPPRLGGTYYRGNDERDPSLFNGGVYRTATMELGLVNQANQALQWNAKIEQEPLSISLLIQRAPRTTAMLFNERIFQDTHLRRFRETDLVSADSEDESGKIGFSMVDPEQSWIARIPLEPSSDWKDGRNAGVIYLSYGSQEMDGYQGRVHYGIRYDLRLKEGLLSPESVLWMGAIYDLGGRVLIPQGKEVLLHHWFDYRPLPIIETDNPDDPELLGLPEHLGAGK